MVLQISNNGEYSEYVGVTFYLPEKDYLMSSNSMLVGNSNMNNSEARAAHMPFNGTTFKGLIRVN